MRQLSLDDNMETVSYAAMQGLRDHSRHCHDIINKELIIREKLREIIGLDREQWNVLIGKAANEAGYDFADLDPFRVFKDISHLCSAVVMRSPDPFARTIAERIIESIGETLKEDIVTLDEQVRSIVEGKVTNGAS
jgi:hypothetical protein